eukprot:m.191277 g.191277  ORF g.191277 m.191277 type:complete len:244 (-) comp15646_c0_seq1:2001-2732(-)
MMDSVTTKDTTEENVSHKREQDGYQHAALAALRGNFKVSRASCESHLSSIGTHNCTGRTCKCFQWLSLMTQLLAETGDANDIVEFLTGYYSSHSVEVIPSLIVSLCASYNSTRSSKEERLEKLIEHRVRQGQQSNCEMEARDYHSLIKIVEGFEKKVEPLEKQKSQIEEIPTGGDSNGNEILEKLMAFYWKLKDYILYVVNHSKSILKKSKLTPGEVLVLMFGSAMIGTLLARLRRQKSVSKI